MHPVVMALSYGSTFISTSAIVGFGGVAAMYGMGILWLVFLNIFVGIFIAFVVFGEPTRRMAHRLGAHTFPELMGRRFQSRFIHLFAGLAIFLFMPLYTTAVLLGGAEFMQVMFRIPDFYAALFILAFIIAAYVLAGGLKGVMYTDALQAGIMVLGMIVLAVITYGKLGGITAAHDALTNMADRVPESLRAQGHRGWTRFPQAGWGGPEYGIWWTLVSTIILGVGIGVLAQPQLIVRFMTVKSKRELNRAVAVGGLFILLLPGVAYTVGTLTNAYFERERILCEVIDDEVWMAPGPRGQLEALGPDASEAERAGARRFVAYRLPDDEPGTAPHYVLHTEAMRIERDVEPGVDAMMPGLISVDRTLGQGSLPQGNPDKIIPIYVESAMPRWFGVVFLLTLLSAAMSTLSGQFHAMGTALARDVVGALMPMGRTSDRAAIRLMRISIIIGLAASILLGAKPLRGYIAVATALFFGLCAASFLPSFIGALFWKRMTKAGAAASMVGGFVVSGGWMVFCFEKTARGLGLCEALTGQTVLLTTGNWSGVDPLFVALPVSTILAVAVSLMTEPADRRHIEQCFAAGDGPLPAPALDPGAVAK